VPRHPVSRSVSQSVSTTLLAGSSWPTLTLYAVPLSGAATRSTFYTVTARGGGLPSWSTQIGSFNRARVMNMLKFMHPHQLQRGGNWTARQLAGSVLAEAVLCRTLAQELSAHAALRALRPAVLLVDAEGLDCRIVAAQVCIVVLMVVVRMLYVGRLHHGNETRAETHARVVVVCA